MGKTVKQSAFFKASPRAVFLMIIDEHKHSQFTGAKATVEHKVGGKFTAYGNDLSGFTLEVIPNKKIVQAWRASDWPKGHYSLVTFAFAPEKGGTRLDFTQVDVPDDQYRGISQGWKDYYWKPMKKALEK